MSTVNDLFTVKQVSALLGISPGRVRKLCIDHKIGTKLGRDRVLTAGDITRLRDARGKPGRPRLSDKSENLSKSS